MWAFSFFVRNGKIERNGFPLVLSSLPHHNAGGYAISNIFLRAAKKITTQNPGE